MVTEPLAVDGLLKEADLATPAMHPQTEVGHIHLSVSSLAKAEKFYANVLGFAITTRSYPGALFLAAGGYHHHVGTNVWYTHNGAPAPSNAVGLIEFGIAVPQATWKRLREVLRREMTGVGEPSEGVMKLRDFDGIGVEVIGL